MTSLKSLNTLLLIIEFLLCVGGFITPELGFGHGLGDLFYYVALYPLTIIPFIWFFKIRKAGSEKHIAPLIIFSISTLYFSLEATIWRGPEAPIYFNVSQDDDRSNRIMYEVTNGSKTDYIEMNDPKEKYISILKITVTATNNKIALINSGNLIRPDTLKHYLKKNKYKYIIVEGKNPFAIDTVNKTVFVKGQIVGLKDTLPIFHISSY